MKLLVTSSAPSTGLMSMRAIGVMTTAVPQAPASSKVSSSSRGMGRFSTVMPRSSATVCRLLLVMDGSTLSESGVMYLLSLMPKKLDEPNSSTNSRVPELRNRSSV